MILEAILAAVPSKTISFEVVPKLAQPGYSDIIFADGKLIVRAQHDRVCTNVSDIGKDIVHLIPTTNTLGLHARKSIRDDWEAKKVSIEKSLKDITKVDWTFHLNWEKITADIPENTQQKYKLKPGYVVFITLEGFVKNLAKQATDAILVEGLLDAAPKRTLSYSIIPKLTQGGYHDVVVLDGGIAIQTQPDRVCTNIGDIGLNLMEKLPSSKPLSLLNQKSVRDDWEAKKHDMLKALKDSTGVDWNFAVDFVALAAIIPETQQKYRHKVGYVAQVSINSLIEKIVKKSKDDMVKEAIVAAVTKKTISYHVLPVKEVKGSYFDVVIKDGVLTINCKLDRVCTNLGDYGQDLEKIL